MIELNDLFGETLPESITEGSEPDRPVSTAGFRPRTGKNHVVCFFPGLGSRAHYQNLGRSLMDSGLPEVIEIYEQGAQALGFPGQPEKVLLVAENLPSEKMAQRGFVGAAFLIHSLALEAHLRGNAEQHGAPIAFMACTGESLGVVSAAVASGSLRVADGVRIAQAFTPLMLMAADGAAADDAFSRQIISHLPAELRGKRLVTEPHHVLGLSTEPETLGELLEQIEAGLPATDVEVHKSYSWRQANIYVRAGARPGFDQFMRRFPTVAVEELKPPTTFLAHSARMREARRAFELFIDRLGIQFRDPRIPVISNHGAGLLSTGDEVRNGILAISDEAMASRDTVETADGLDPDMILELGLGHKSVRLLADNNIRTPSMAYTGSPDEDKTLFQAMKLIDDLIRDLNALQASGESFQRRHHDLLSDLFRLMATDPFYEQYVRRTMDRFITLEMLRADPSRSTGLQHFLEAFQHTSAHRKDIDIHRGELVVRARLKKEILGRPEEVGRPYVELEVVGAERALLARTSAQVEQPEVVIFHFDRLPKMNWVDLARKTRLMLDSQPQARQIYAETFTRTGLADLSVLTSTGPTPPTPGQQAASRIAYQYTLFQLFRAHRPAVLAQNDCYLESNDPEGWLTALAVADAVTLPQILAPYAGARGSDPSREVLLTRTIAGLREATFPLISAAGVPLRSRKEIEVATQVVLAGGALPASVRRIHLNGNCLILSLGSPPEPATIDAGPFRQDVIAIRSPSDLWKHRVNPALDAFESLCRSALTRENGLVLRQARSRRILRSTVNAYIGVGETIVGFGAGGSESMTIFLKKDGEERITVRKILSEALTTVTWDPEGTGVMLPPFAKAQKQAELLQSLPNPVRRRFPEVYSALEREIPVPAHLRQDGRTAFREVIYEMSYVPGVEVSRFVERHSPPPAVIARLYELIFLILHREVHAVDRAPAPSKTLEISYFRKIEERLRLCRRNAPVTFSPQLLDTERIVINGQSYLNSSALLRRFRENQHHLLVLEPRFHSLVMGDTNTENIKVTHIEPLLQAQRVIEAGAPAVEVERALAMITPESLGIRFLDPRAIGFKGDGRHTRDDPMYDNKPWHNSIGHYDEIHYEQFTLKVRTGRHRTPEVDIEFIDDNPYQRSYRVRDVEARGSACVDQAAGSGMEDYFAPVINAVYGLDDPESPTRKDDPHWLVRFVFMMGTHFTAMPPFHFQSEPDGTLTDTYQSQRRPVAIYCEGIKWLNWALQLLDGERDQFLGIPASDISSVLRPKT